MMRQISRFFGGVHPPQHKSESTRLPVALMPIPKQLILPMQQHIGKAAEPIVHIGEHVLKGQKIARAVDYVSAPVHASSSGVVVDIGDYPVPHPSGLPAPCIVIETDGEDKWCELYSHAHDYQTLDPSALRNLIREAGIVGLGGAGFPSFIKMNPGPGRIVETLIINAAECEPYITCDDMLMRDKAAEIVAGITILRHAIQAKNVVVAIEDNKPYALSAMSKAISEFGDSTIVVTAVPTRYPMGGEKQLILTVTGKEVPKNGLPVHVGIVCQNIATVVAIYRAVDHGEPLISRYVTVTGDVVQARNFEVLFGTRIRDLLAQSGGVNGSLRRLLIGGPMMGFAVHSDAVPVIKTTNCLLVDAQNAKSDLNSRQYAMPCIRCGKCAEVCPVQLQPHQLYWHAKAQDIDELQEYSLFDCIECGCCDYVCPSHIPLVQYYRFAKGEIWSRQREKQKSDIARDRFEYRQHRLEREKAERAEKHKKKKAELELSSPAARVTDAAVAEQGAKAPDPKKAAILAALERAQVKKTQQNMAPKNVDNLTEAQKQLIAEVDARRAKQRQTEHAPNTDQPK